MAAPPPAGGAPPAKAEPPPPMHHEIMEQMPGLRYCIHDNPDWPEAIILGFQHYIINLGTIVLFSNIIVPLMGGNDGDRARVIQTILFVSGLNTLLQTTVGSRLPVILGVSFTYLVPILSIINTPRLQRINDDHERFKHTMREIQGALIAGSSLQIILGFSGIWGILTRWLSPVAIAPLVVMTALGLYPWGFPQVGKCVEIGIPTIILALVFSQYLWHLRVKVKKHYHVFELFPVLITLLLVWGYAYILTVSGAYDHASVGGQRNCRTDRANLIQSAPWVRVPYPLEWGAPTFDAGHAFGIMSAVFASVVESTAGFYAAYRLSGATPPPPFVISRGIGWGGIAILLSGIFGTASGTTVSIENIGLIGITRIGSRRVIQISAAWMIVFSIFGKFGGLFASIPVPLFAGFFTILFGIVAAVGISSLHFVNMNKTRNLFIVGFALYMGFSVPFYFYQYRQSAGYGPVHTDGKWFNDIVNVFFSSNAIVALLIAALLDNTMRSKQITAKDRGMHWFHRFHEFSKDPRNEEFYKLPYMLHKYFPPT
ncbi:hypothetical protein R1sor_009485 [Riccia sorocarpa]|uniref:Uncharacterized protein n=1 Tax=Riccia sorocarpa TaxID=122646 RepID=A0ABD3HX90_9MARC